MHAWPCTTIVKTFNLSCAVENHSHLIIKCCECIEKNFLLGLPSFRSVPMPMFVVVHTVYLIWSTVKTVIQCCVYLNTVQHTYSICKLCMDS